MNKQLLDVSKEFGDQLIKYLKYFNLIEADLARLINSNTDDIKEILDGRKGVVLKTAERISNVFGLRYFEFGNPKLPLPKIKNLPVETQETIKNREKRGVPERVFRNTELNLNLYVKKALLSSKLAREFTCSDLLKLLPLKVQEQVNTKRIINLFRKGELKDIVEDTGKTLKIEGKRGPKEVLFKLREMP